MSTAVPPLAVTLDVSAIPRLAAGAGQYVLALSRGLACDQSVVPTLVSRRDDAERWREAMSGVAGQARRTATSPSVMPAAPPSRLARLLWEQFALPGLLHRVSPDVHHSPHYTMPERKRVPTVVTVHDCTFFDHPELHQRSKVVLFRRAIRVAARRADALICVSETTARRLAEACEVRAPVFVATHGVDHARFTPAEPEPGADRAVLGTLGIDAEWPFVAFVGTVEPRKGVPTLVRAFGKLSRHRLDLRLVVAGQPGWGTGEVERAIAEVPGAGRILRLGYVPPAAVPALLRCAAAVAYPSLAEGYGLPAVEALACGASLVTTQGTAMAEMAGSSALLVPPGDEAALADAIDHLLSEPDDRVEQRRRSGLAVAASHTWAASIARHLEAYRHAAERGHRQVG